MTDDTGSDRPSGLWGGRFREGPAPELERLNNSLRVDWRLWPYELEVDAAWVEELAAQGHVPEELSARLLDGLAAVGRRLEAGDPAAEADEDIHSLIERWLEEEVGPTASLVRLGRSRNDVVATDTRLWTAAANDRTRETARDLQAALVETATDLVDVPFPAYTHLQRAQPTRAAHWLLSHFWPLERDLGRVDDAQDRVLQLPLGAAAGTGSGLAVDRARLAVRLGFRGVLANSLDAVGSRDWVSETLFAWTQIAMDVSRLAEDLVVYSSAEFGLVRISDRYSTGSSLMPHKRNPDAAELARARAAVLLGSLTGFMASVRALPTGYNKDLQEDKAALFGAEAALTEVLRAIAGTVRTLEVDRERAAVALDPAMLTADLAEWMAGPDLPFSEAHEIAGKLVRLAEERGVAVSKLEAGDFTDIHARLGELPADFWSVEAALERRTVSGGSGRAAVERQLAAAREALG